MFKLRQTATTGTDRTLWIPNYKFIERSEGKQFGKITIFRQMMMIAPHPMLIKGLVVDENKKLSNEKKIYHSHPCVTYFERVLSYL